MVHITKIRTITPTRFEITGEYTAPTPADTPPAIPLLFSVEAYLDGTQLHVLSNPNNCDANTGATIVAELLKDVWQ